MEHLKVIKEPTLKEALKENKELKLRLQEQKIIVTRLQKQITDLYTTSKSHAYTNELKGEALEVIVFEQLHKIFTEDLVEEVKRGQRGVDIEQQVYKENKHQGVIYIECKRTKNFSDTWISKLKQKLQENPNSFGVIVYEGTNSINNTYFDEGIIICDLESLINYLGFVRRLVILKKEKDLVNINEKMSYIEKELSKDLKTALDLVSKNHEQIKKERNYMQKAWDKRALDLNKMTDHLFNIKSELLDD